jgi:N-acetylglutamate synthase-like GNAT family acetyltransferase
MFQDRKELVEGIKELKEVKTMLRTSLKKYEKKIVQETIQKEKRTTAKSLLKEKMSLKKISEITGLTVDEIEKLMR